VVDDEEGIRYALTRVLESAGQKVYAAASGKEALELLAAHPAEMSLCICDFKMPGMDGIETLTEAHRQDPELLRVLLTGYATLEAAIEATNRGLDAFVTKPYQVRELRAKLEELLSRKASEVATRTLGAVPLFQGIPGEVLTRIWPSLTPVQARRGAVVQEAGEVPTRLFIIREGEVALEARAPDGRQRPVAWLAAGEQFGEQALVLAEKSVLRAVAVVDCKLMALERRDFDLLRAQVPQLADAVVQAFGRRLQGIVEGPTRPNLVVACSAIEGRPLAARQLAAALAAVGADVALLDLEAGRAEGEPGPLDAVKRHRNGPVVSYALASAAADEVPRAVAALRQHHRLLVLALPERPGDLLERARGQAHCEVAWGRNGGPEFVTATVTGLVHGPSAPLIVFAGELSAAGPSLRRLSRRILGASVGLALSAGNARGVAHVGVLRAFQRAGLEVDALAGCSMGAVIGGLLASGVELGDLPGFLESANLHRLGAPGLSLGKPAWATVRARIHEVCRGRTMEEAAVPFLCNAADLETGALAVFDSGSIATAVCASMASPPLFPHYYRDGRAYGDGALINGLPADLLVARGLHVVAAVDVLHKQSSWKAPAEARGGRVAALLAGMPALVRYAAMFGLLQRAVAISIRELVEAHTASSDLTIRPEMDSSPLDWDPAHFPAKVEAGERAGEEAARALIERQRQLLRPWSAPA